MKMPSLCKSPKQKPFSFQNVILCEFCRNLFIDCAVQAGSNPTVMLIKELIETEQITGEQATWAVAALGYHVKTPTQELLKEFVVRFTQWRCKNVISFHRKRRSFKFPFSISESVEVWSGTIVQVIVANRPDDGGRFAEFSLQLSSLCRQKIPRLRHGRFLR
jgi:hypothetical protein